MRKWTKFDVLRFIDDTIENIENGFECDTIGVLRVVRRRAKIINEV